MKEISKPMALLAITITFVAGLNAQSYSIDWHTISGGGGMGAGGNYNLSGTIGQHDATAPMTGGNFSITGGFWMMPLAVKTPGVPTLLIVSTGHNVTIFWQDTPGWSLQQSGNPASPAGWSASNGSSIVNGTHYLTLTNPPGNHFFRLFHP